MGAGDEDLGKHAKCLDSVYNQLVRKCIGILYRNAPEQCGDEIRGVSTRGHRKGCEVYTRRKSSEIGAITGGPESRRCRIVLVILPLYVAVFRSG